MAGTSFRFGWSTLRLPLVVAGSALFVYLTVVMPIARNHGLIGADEASYIAPAVAIVHGTGAPYVDYFDVKPPGLIFFFVPWVALVGSSMKSLIVLDLLLLAGNLTAFFYLLRRVASPLLRDIVYGVSIAAAFGLELYGGMFIPSETIGSLLLLLALAVAFRFRSQPQAFLLVGALCALAGQVKEVWFFTIIPLAVLALLEKPGRWKTLGCLTAGWMAMQGLLVGGLVAVGALGAYADVLRYKATLFPLPGLRTLARETVNTVVSESSTVFSLWPIFPIVVGLSVYFRVRVLGMASAIREFVGFKESLPLVSFLTWACLVLGYVWQNKPVMGHSFIALFLPFILLTTAGLVYVRHAFSESWRILGRPFVVVVVVALCLIPSTNVLAGLGDRYQEAGALNALPWPAMESSDSMRGYAVMASHLNGTRCMQVAYGWDAGAAYVYAGANPCSRYFLANLLTNEVVIDEFRRDMTARPPDVIVYETGMADLDVRWFEKTVFPYSLVLADCYTATDAPTVFQARYGPVQQSRCIGDQLRLLATS